MKFDLDGRDRRIEDLKNQMIANNQGPSIVTNLGASDSGQLRSRVIGLESSLQAARDAQNRAKMDADRSYGCNSLGSGRLLELLQKRSGKWQFNFVRLKTIWWWNELWLSNVQIIELENLKQQNKRLQDQLAKTANADRDILKKN